MPPRKLNTIFNPKIDPAKSKQPKYTNRVMEAMKKNPAYKKHMERMDNDPEYKQRYYRRILK